MSYDITANDQLASYTDTLEL